MKASRAMLAAVSLVCSIGCGASDRSAHTENHPVHQNSEDADHPHLALSRDHDALTVRLSASSAAVRMAEIFIQTEGDLALVGFSAGNAATHANKEVHVQDKGNGLFRVVIFSSTNIARLEGGELAVLQLRKAHPEAKATARILIDRPIFAPQEAQNGLTVGDPIEL